MYYIYIEVRRGVIQLQLKTIMLLLFIRLPGQPRPKRESNKRPNQPPLREQEQRSPARILQGKTTEAIRKTSQVYHLERRLFF